MDAWNCTFPRAGFKTFFGHVTKPMRQMVAFDKSARPAAEIMRAYAAEAEIMRAYAAEDAARGRNDECSCGSGRKFKRCHGDRRLPSLAAIDAAAIASSPSSA
jgi:uncharacterized protein